MIHSLKVNDVLGYKSSGTGIVYRYQIASIQSLADGRAVVDIFPLDEDHRKLIRGYPLDLPLNDSWSMVSSQPIEEYV